MLKQNLLALFFSFIKRYRKGQKGTLFGKRRERVQYGFDRVARWQRLLNVWKKV